MKVTQPTRKWRRSDFPALLGRWLLGGLFLYLGLSKVLHPAEFGELVREQLAITNPFLSGLIVTTLPWLEVLYGILLLTGIARNTAAVLGRLVAPGSRLIRADLVVPWHVARRWASGHGPGAGRWLRQFEVGVGISIPRSAFRPPPPNGVALLVIRRRHGRSRRT